ncbi:MAG TPA: SpoIIE family protein phosphatase [Anaerolineae bacterium]|nr:SpoIIE family protein phosphatase [Anaerolineae bacterium]
MSTDRRIAELTTLNEIAATLNESLDLQSALRSSLDRLVRLMGLTTGWIFLLDPDAWDGPALLIHTADFQLPPGLAASDAALMKSHGCACQDLFDSGKFKKSVNILECSRIEDVIEAGGDAGGLRIHASVPIRARDRVIGILNVASPSVHQFSDEDLQLMTAVGNQIGLAAERARLYDLTRARRVIEQDALLKLSNALIASRDMQAVVDQVVQVVAEVLSVDACALVLAVEDEEGGIEFRASVGWDLSMLMLSEGRLKFGWQSPAGAAYYTNQPIRSDDLPTDPRFPDADLYQHLSLRSVLAVPVDRSGQAIGALVVNTRAPRHFGDDDVRLLQLMANQAAIAIETARLQERALAEQRLRKELELARQIQASFLPQDLPRLSGWEFGAYYASAREVGGDFYDFIPLRDPSLRPTDLPGAVPEGGSRLGMVIADVSDKGVPAALLMALSRTLVRAVTAGGRSPADAIRRVNELLLSESQTGQFITLFYAVLDPESAALRFVNAGHNPPLMVCGEAVFSLCAPGMALGIMQPIHLTESEARFAPGDVLVMYTDGVTEALDAGMDEFGVERLTQVVLANRPRSAQDIVNAIVDAVHAFTGGREAFDDISIVALKRTS